MKKIFIAATRQNDGKTSVSLGLFHAFSKRFSKIAYMKPVGQQYKLINGEKIDKDAVLFKQVYDLQDPLSWMSPIAVPAGFTEAYTQNPNRAQLVHQVSHAFDQLSQGKDMVVVEGTGHGGVGSVFDMSNADVASLLGAKIILVTIGGVGKPIDEVMLNKAFFESKGCEILGVVINKVQTEKFERVGESLSKGLARHGVPILGIMPFVNMLTQPTVAEMVEDLEATLLSGAEGLTRRVDKFVVGAMLPHDAMGHLSKNTLLIMPANREDLIMTALCGHVMEGALHYDVAAIIFTGGIQLHPKMVELLCQAQIPSMIVEEDSFAVATKINKMLFKLRAEETEKIDVIQSLVEQYVQVDHICGLL